MRPHKHYPGCPYSGEPDGRAWWRHLRAAAAGFLMAVLSLYLCIVVVAVCLKVIR